jgi:polyisoprenoid-binding protein YceI
LCHQPGKEIRLTLNGAARPVAIVLQKMIQSFHGTHSAACRRGSANRVIFASLHKLQGDDHMKRLAAFIAGSLALVTAWAEPVTYNIDPSHTYAAFEADHMGGMSIWRGKINTTGGKIVLDTQAGTGTVEVTVDMATINFNHEAMNQHARSPDIFNVAQYPTATFTGKLTGFRNGAPTEVQGNLTMHGVTRPVTLKINSFKCQISPMTKKDTCGADAVAHINREDFGVDYDKKLGFKMEVTVPISIEAVRAE